VALLPEHAVGSTFDGGAVYAVFRATPGLPGALLGGAAVGAFSDEPLAKSDREPKNRRIKHPQVELVGAIDEPLLGGIDLQAFATSGKPIRF